MKVSELKKLLKKAGCVIVRHGSRHDVWFSKITGKEFVLPRHGSKELPTGTCDKIRKDAGV